MPSTSSSSRSASSVGLHPTRIGDVFGGRYTVEGKLGKGQFSTVWLCRDVSKLSRASTVALKVYRSVDRFAKFAEEEAAILRHAQGCEALGLRPPPGAGGAAARPAPAGRCVVGLLEHFLHEGPDCRHACIALEGARGPVFGVVDGASQSAGIAAAGLTAEQLTELVEGVGCCDSCRDDEDLDAFEDQALRPRVTVERQFEIAKVPRARPEWALGPRVPEKAIVAVDGFAIGQASEQRASTRGSRPTQDEVEGEIAAEGAMFSFWARRALVDPGAGSDLVGLQALDRESRAMAELACSASELQQAFAALARPAARAGRLDSGLKPALQEPDPESQRANPDGAIVGGWSLVAGGGLPTVAEHAVAPMPKAAADVAMGSGPAPAVPRGPPPWPETLGHGLWQLQEFPGGLKTTRGAQAAVGRAVDNAASSQVVLGDMVIGSFEDFGGAIDANQGGAAGLRRGVRQMQLAIVQLLTMSVWQ
ncbi:unnamed protein product [Prorocentrum cordatum]|uniref:non-specific serine/threonine protein kinase n=1 Tax=Prorocentrum cordatum TaxID=2364126 RepID=A0ABN9T445_9DINO|nr:unnamed protein product [Polarella glacialis]